MVEIHYHYETQTILSAHVNKENAVAAAIKESEGYDVKLVMKEYSNQLCVLEGSCVSFNVLEIELDKREFYEV